MGPSDRFDHGALQEQAVAYALGALGEPERAAFESHLAACPDCTADVRELSAIGEALARVVPQIDPPPALRARILASIGSDRQERSAPEAARTRGIAGTHAWWAAAAVLVLAAGVGVYAVQLRSRVADLEGQLRRETFRANSAEAQILDARKTAGEARLSVAVLIAPDLARIDLAGQAAAPRASARAYWSRSRGLLFSAANLPPPPPGRAYQLWVITAQPAPISVGLLKPDPAGAATAVFQTPPDIPMPRAMAVTIEPELGVPSPTGDKYLVGLAN